MLAAAIGTGEEGVLAIEREWPDRALDGVGIDLDAPVSEEAAQALPTCERVAQRAGDGRLLRDGAELCFEPGLEGVEERLRLLLSGSAPLLGRRPRMSASRA